MSNAIEFKSPEAAQIFAEQSLLQLHEANQRIATLTADNEALQAELDRYRINLRGEAEQHDELREKFLKLFEENEALQVRLREVEKPCAICQRKVIDAIGEDWCTACDADERLHAAKAANDALAATIARMTEDAELQKRIKESSAKVVKGVWEDHERQIAAEKQRADAAEAKLAEFLDRCEGFLDTEGMASSDGEIAETISRFMQEARETK